MVVGVGMIVGVNLCICSVFCVGVGHMCSLGIVQLCNSAVVGVGVQLFVWVCSCVLVLLSAHDVRFSVSHKLDFGFLSHLIYSCMKLTCQR